MYIYNSTLQVQVKKKGFLTEQSVCKSIYKIQNIDIFRIFLTNQKYWKPEIININVMSYIIHYLELKLS